MPTAAATYRPAGAGRIGGPCTYPPGPRPSACRRGYDRRHRDRRAKIFVRDGGRCQRCGALVALHAGQGLPVMHLDHIVPQSHGGGNECGNLQTLCPTCNARKAREGW